MRGFRVAVAKVALSLMLVVVSIGSLTAASKTTTEQANELVSGQTIAKGVEVLGMEKCEFKGLTSFLFAVRLRSTTNVEYSMEGGEVALLLEGDTVALLKQNAPAVLKPHTEDVVNILWNIERIEPMSMMLLSAKMMQKSYSGMAISYRATFNEGRRKRELVKKNLDLEKFMTIFAPAILSEMNGGSDSKKSKK